MKKPVLKSIEGEDLIFYNYKEPLKPVEKGYGYYGVILSTDGGERIQCHICGKTFEELQAHVRQFHRMTVPDYRNKYQLAYTTALISESIRQERKLHTLKWLKNMTPEYRRELLEKQKEGMRRWLKKRGQRLQPELTLESKNKRGTCPDQLLARIKEVADKVGHSPSKAEFISYYGHKKFWRAILYTFGSWVIAKERLGYSRLRSSKRYTDEELLQALKDYYINNKKIPTKSDCMRGLLPSDSTYTSRFGGLRKARELAGIVSKYDRIVE